MKGRRYQINSPTMAVGLGGSNGRMQLVTVHKGALIEVSGDSQPSGLVDVVYGGRIVMMFQQDIEDRGERVLATAVQPKGNPSPQHVIPEIPPLARDDMES